MLDKSDYIAIYGTDDDHVRLSHYRFWRDFHKGLTPFNKVNYQQQRTGVRNDYFSIYLYGSIVKVVYHKTGIIEQSKKEKSFVSKIPKSEDERFSSSISRTKSKVFELSACNEFTHFCTFTQDEKMRDRFDLKAFRKDFTMLIRNMNRNRSEDNKIKYLLIPEKHKKGGWHLHGLFMGLTDNDLRAFTLSEKLPYHIRHSLQRGKTVYDWTAYRKRFGYFTCTKIENPEACSRYITKYISKDFQKEVRGANEHLFFASQGLKRREPIVLNSFDPCPFTDFDFENDFIKIKTFSLNDLDN